MKETKVYCDSCGKEIRYGVEYLETYLITDKSVKHYIGVRLEFIAGNHVDGNHMYHIDICDDCVGKLLQDIVNKKDVKLWN